MIRIYSTPDCGVCKEAEKYMKEKNVKFEMIDMSVGGQPDLIEKKKMFKKMGLKAYPVIIIDDLDEEMVFPGFDKDTLDGVIKDIYGK